MAPGIVLSSVARHVVGADDRVTGAERRLLLSEGTSTLIPWHKQCTRTTASTTAGMLCRDASIERHTMLHIRTCGFSYTEGDGRELRLPCHVLSNTSKRWLMA